MENFFYKDDFYSDIDSLLQEHGVYTEQDLDAWLDGRSIELVEGEVKPVFQLDIDSIMNLVNQEKFSEEGNEWDKIIKVLNDNIDFKAINEKMPKLCYQRETIYPTDPRVEYTKEDLMEYITPTNL